MKLSAGLLFCSLLSAAPAPQALSGRWDLTLKTPTLTYPSWIEISGDPAAVRIVGQVASVHPAKSVNVTGNGISFSSSEYLGKTVEVEWDVHLAGSKLMGTQKRADGTTADITGVRAPALNRPAPAKWSDPMPLFDGKDLTGWQAITTGEPGKSPQNNWKAENGELVNQAAGANIRTAKTFGDFKLHVEYNCPDRGNSGVYLRGRYETQVEYEPAGTNDSSHGMGAIYGFLSPSQMLPKKPGQWESYDITLIGRRVTVVRDGVTTIDNEEIPGITGGALDSREGEPGPIYIQGDHTGGMKYRNVTISVPKS